MTILDKTDLQKVNVSFNHAMNKLIPDKIQISWVPYHLAIICYSNTE